MALATWWRDDKLPVLFPLKRFYATRTQDEALLSRLTGLDGHEIQRRLWQGNRPYVAFIDGVPAAYGWVATRHASIGELNLDFRLPSLHRYLWDFATLPAFRGRGIYPHLLQEILVQEMGTAYYFWIIRAPENVASGKGIGKAGFAAVGHLSLTEDGRTALAPNSDFERAEMGATLLGVPLVERGLFPCWHCAGADYPPAANAAHCTCQSGQMDNCLCVIPTRRRQPETAFAGQLVPA